MLVRSPRRSVFVSVLLHAGVGLVAIVVARHTPHATPALGPAAPTVVELDLAPSPAVAPAPAPAVVPTPAAAAVSHPSGRPSPSVSHDVAPPVVAPPVVAPVVAPPVVAPPVLTAPATTPMRASDLMQAQPSDAFAVWGAAPSIAQAQAARARARSFVDQPTGTPEERAIAASSGYIHDQLAATHQHEAPGVRGYYWALRRRMLESWRPGLSRMPTLGETLLATLGTPPAALAEVLRSANGAAVTPGRQGAAIDALEEHNTARSNNPAERTQVPFQGIVDASRGNVRTTRAEVEVVQGEDGQVLTVRLLHPSHMAGFDRAAEDAVREALPLQTPVAMPGGRRSRWSFEVVASRDPFIPGVGFEFDESSGWFEMHWPGRAHVRSRVWLEDAAPVSHGGRAPQG